MQQLLSKHRYKKRKIQRRLSSGEAANRDAQFKKIARIIKKYKKVGNPVLSVDTKKKEPIGKLHREGSCYSKREISSYDHDFPTLAQGIAIPHGIYDVSRNKEHITIGTSCETSEFICDSIKQWWQEHGINTYPQASSILLLMDGGGSNSSRCYLFKQELEKLANAIKLEIRIAHYPPYSSKWNPIEHRLFPHVSRALQGVLLKDYNMLKELVEKTTTEKGLEVTASIMDQVYEKGKKVAKDFKANRKVLFDRFLGQWNYRVRPVSHSAP